MTEFVEGLRRFKQGGVAANYPTNLITLYAPEDQVHDALEAMIKNAQRSIHISMFGFDDPKLAGALIEQLKNNNVFVELVLDRSQSKGAHEKQILAQDWSALGNVITIGNSEDGAIIHRKMIVVDSRFVAGGSTNWSVSGETKQDNELTIIDDYAMAADAIVKINRCRAHILAAQHKTIPVNVTGATGGTA